MSVSKGYVFLTCLFILLQTASVAQIDCGWNPDYDNNGSIGVPDLLALLGVFEEMDSDGDGIFDSQDDCYGVVDVCGVCAGSGTDLDSDGVCDEFDDCVGTYDLCGECNGTNNDVDGDSLCDFIDPCIGYFDECGVCNGPGPIWPFIDSITILTDSIYIDQLQEWYVFTYGADTTFTYSCIASDCFIYENDILQPDYLVGVLPDTLNICQVHEDDLFFWNSLDLTDTGWEILSLVNLATSSAQQINLINDDSWAPVEGDYTYEITDGDGWSCLGLLHVNSSIIPVASFVAEDNQCANLFTAENTSVGEFGTTYSWDFGDGSPIVTGDSANHNYSVILPSGEATFEVVLSATSWDGACSSTASQTVTVLPFPVPPFTFAPPLCQSDVNWPNYELLLPPHPPVTSWHINWGNGLDTAFSVPSFASPPGTVYSDFGLFDITLTVEGLNGCSNTMVEEVFVGSTPTIGTANPGNTVGLCSPRDLVFPITEFENNVVGTSYTIDFGDGAAVVYNHPPPVEVFHSYQDDSCGETTPAGTSNALRFKVTASNGCGTSISTIDPIRLHRTPDPQLAGPTLVCAGVYDYSLSGSGLVVTNQDCEDSDAYWSVEVLEGNGSTFVNPSVGLSSSIEFTEPGLYAVSVYDYHPYCEDGQDTLDVCVIPEPSLNPWYEVPNEESPNGFQFYSGVPELACGNYDLEWSIYNPALGAVESVFHSETFYHEFTDAGIYTITLTASVQGGGCVPFEQVWEIEIN